MGYGRKLLFEPIRSSAYSAIGSSYTAIGNPFDNQIRLFIINNDTDAPVFISFDGTNDHIFVPSFGHIVLDIAGNRVTEGGFFLSKRCDVFQKKADASLSPTTGSLYISAGYALGD